MSCLRQCWKYRPSTLPPAFHAVLSYSMVKLFIVGCKVNWCTWPISVDLTWFELFIVGWCLMNIMFHDQPVTQAWLVTVTIHRSTGIGSSASQPNAKMFWGVSWQWVNWTLSLFKIYCMALDIIWSIPYYNLHCISMSVNSFFNIDI